jgi:signal peptide peptidase SppA
MTTSDNAFMEAFSANALLIDAEQVGMVNASLKMLTESEDGAKLLSAPMASGSFWDPYGDGSGHAFRPYNVQNGTLLIPVQGVLLNKFSFSFGRWATGYDYIEQALIRGMADSNVQRVALVVDSPGGEVAGCFELADKVHAARGEKPIRAFASDHAYSAAYALASSASELVVSRSGGTGSVGVVTSHMDVSEALAKQGIKVTFIYAGDHKVDGNPYQKLPDSVKARIQDRIDRIYGVFTSSVARNRDMDEKAVRDTEALTFDATDSVANGFADRIGALNEELVAFSGETTTTEKDELAMADYTQEQLDSAVATARAEATAEATAAAATAERQRISAILNSDEGKARPVAALSTAMKTGMSAEDAVAFLSDLPEEKAEAKTTEAPAAKGKTPFDSTMDASGNPKVGATLTSDDDEEDDLDDDDKATASIVGAMRGYRGIKK